MTIHEAARARLVEVALEAVAGKPCVSCNGYGHRPGSLAIIDVDIEIERPDWCPLNDGAITIKAGEP
jgi:hypothetical protein